MGGFPNRPLREAFGPTRIDEEPVENPERELGAADMNLDFHQVSGMGLTAARAVIGVMAVGTPVTPNFYQGIAWDPKQTLPDIVVTRVGLGVYQAVFQATYPDQDGTAVPTALKGGAAHPQSLGNAVGNVLLADPQVADIEIYLAGVLADLPFILTLW